ncbi:MAG: hypothetical protein RBR59_05230 [Sulfurimonadaceae bacterium]|nr:hypothetical protein [Sulfurimonadaceae bacterium]
MFETSSKKIIKPKLLSKKELREKEIAKVIEFYKTSPYHTFTSTINPQKR